MKKTRRPFSTRKKKQTSPLEILPHVHHPISDESLPDEVVWILNRLRWAGHLAYVVGGGVRDLLLGTRPKDFDLSTDATPHQIRQLFLNCRIIGRRFRIAHIYFRDGQVIEVTTFRRRPQRSRRAKGPLREDNQFGTPSEDAWRRDITINGLFYDSATKEVLDYVGGLEDLESRTVRTIGDPNVRFQEDPVRMVRVLRHAARIDGTIEPKTWDAICRQAHMIHECADARILEEFFRELRGGNAYHSLQGFEETGLLEAWLPTVSSWLQRHPPSSPKVPPQRFGPFASIEWTTPAAFWSHLQTIDEAQRQGEFIPDIVLLATILLPLGWSYVTQRYEPGLRTSQLWHRAFSSQWLPIIRELKLRAAQRERLFQILHTYWRLHLRPLQRSLHASIQRSPMLRECLQLFQLELRSHQVKLPTWFHDFHDPSSRSHRSKQTKTPSH